jgi:flavorubredoxin
MAADQSHRVVGRCPAPQYQSRPSAIGSRQSSDERDLEMAKALIVYATRTGETEKIGNLIAEGIRFSGHETHVIQATDVKKAEDLKGYDAVILGSPTYHGEMVQGMKTLLFMAEKADLAGKVGAAFGSFGWSGEAPDRIFETMKNIYKMNMVSIPLRLKSANLGGGMKMAQDYGREIAEKLASAE